MLFKKFLVLSSLLLLSGFCLAQSNDVAFSVGGIFSPDSTGKLACVAQVGVNCTTNLHTDAAVTYEGTIAHRLVNLHLASLHVELPIAGTPNRDVHGAFAGEYSSIFFTPGLRLKLSLPFFSPFVSVGGGLAHFSSSSLGNNTTGAFQVGGGVDMSTPIPLIGFRAEVREFHTGQSNFSTNQQNLFVGGGLVLKF